MSLCEPQKSPTTSQKIKGILRHKLLRWGIYPPVRVVVTWVFADPGFFFKVCGLNFTDLSMAKVKNIGNYDCAACWVNNTHLPQALVAGTDEPRWNENYVSFNNALYISLFTGNYDHLRDIYIYIRHILTGFAGSPRSLHLYACLGAWGQPMEEGPKGRHPPRGGGKTRVHRQRELPPEWEFCPETAMRGEQ